MADSLIGRFEGMPLCKFNNTVIVKYPAYSVSAETIRNVCVKLEGILGCRVIAISDAIDILAKQEYAEINLDEYESLFEE